MLHQRYGRVRITLFEEFHILVQKEMGFPVYYVDWPKQHVSVLCLHTKSRMLTFTISSRVIGLIAAKLLCSWPGCVREGMKGMPRCGSRHK